MTTMRPRQAMAFLLVVGFAAVAAAAAGNAGDKSGASAKAAAGVKSGASGKAGAGGTGGADSSAAAATTPTGHEGHQMPGTPASGKSAERQGIMTTVTGEVMDPACFLEAGPKSIGPGHYQCAIDCARSGQTLAIYDRANDRIYFIAGELPGKNPNDPVINFIHQKVDVTGGVFHRSGVYGIVINKVVPHKDKE